MAAGANWTQPPTPPLALLRRLLFPPTCLACDARVQTEWALCPACWADTPFLGRHVCPTCAAPMPGEPGPGDACDDCLASPRPWDRAVAALRYGARGRDLVLRLKHADRTDLAVPLGTWLARRTAPLVAEGTVVIPVPLHPRRLFTRRYNQAALLARVVGRRLGRPVWADALRRHRATAPLDDISHAERRALLAGTMSVSRRVAPRLAGRPVLLVDDVLTSGATLQEATRALVEAGAARVDVAVVARAARAV